MSEISKRPVLQEADADTIAQLRTLVGSAHFGSLATLEPKTGDPQCTRVGLATLKDGTPIVFVSALAAHTPALVADPRCSLLVGEAGRGDALAHPRATLSCVAEGIAQGTPAHDAALERYMGNHPKAKLYAQLPDFAFFVLRPKAISFNGGFGKAYALPGAAILDR